MVNQLEKERDFYRSQSDELGAQVLRLQKELRASRREAWRYRATAKVVQEMYRLASEGQSLEALAKHLVVILLDTLTADCGAMLRWSGVNEYVLVYSSRLPSNFCINANQPQFSSASSDRIRSLVWNIQDSSKESPVHGLFSYVLSWVTRNPLALLLGNAGSDQTIHQGFDENDRQIVEAALEVYSSVYDLKRTEAALRSENEERRRAEEFLEKLSSAVQQSGSAVVITDRGGTIEYVNPRFSVVTGYSPEEVIGRRTPYFGIDEANAEHRELLRTIELGRDWRGELRSRTRSGEFYWALVSISPIHNEKGQITHFVAVCEDVTELKETQAKIERLAFYDTLTGLENRTLFRERLSQAANASQRSGRSVALLFLDLDHFKRVNDTLGHDAGDRLLQKVAERLRACVRKGDMVSRIGGDEFTVLLQKVEGTAGASIVARKLLEALRRPIHISSQEVLVTASIGITIAPEDSVNAETLMKNADLALYRAKEKGRNDYRFFTEEMNIEVMQRLQLEGELRCALEREEFVLYFQPLVGLTTKEPRSFEALLRWRHPKRGLVPPSEFISIIEESGLVVPIGKWILRSACEQLKRFAQLGFRDVRVAINLSARQFGDPSLVKDVQQILEETKTKGESLELEITESIIMENIEDARVTLRRLKKLGVALSIDDFGTGYSSLSYLKLLPVDILKVDRSFVKEIPNDRRDMEIVSAVIAMSHKLRLTVVAEGVETAAQLAFLQENGCDLAQGYYFGRPQPVDRLAYSRFLPPTAETGRVAM